MAGNDSFERYKTKYNQNCVKEYSGEEGFLISECGTKKIRCKFEAGQFENGKIILACDCSIFDLEDQEIFPNTDFKNTQLSFQKFSLDLVIKLSIYPKSYINDFFKKFKTFEGVTSGKYQITAKINNLINADDSSLNESNLRVKFDFSVKDLVVSTDVEEDSRFIVFEVTNCEFGDKYNCVLPLNIKGVKRLTIRKNENYEDVFKFLRLTKGTRITCEILIELDKYTENFEEIVIDLCDIISIALGTKVQWIYYYACNSNGKKVLWKHESRVTKPYISNNIIDFYDNETLKQFIESSYVALARKSHMLRNGEKTAKPLINAYLAAKEDNDYLEGRGLRLVVLMEMLKDSFIMSSKSVTQNIIKEEHFEKAKLKIKEELIQVIGDSIDQENEEKSKQDREKLKEKIQEKMFAKISDINRVSFKEVLQSLCDSIKLQVTNDYLQSVVDSRNKLIHEGKFLCESDKIRNKYKNIEKYPQFRDSTYEYYFLMNFIDKCFLKLLCYKGFYWNWGDIDDIKLEYLP